MPPTKPVAPTITRSYRKAFVIKFTRFFHSGRDLFLTSLGEVEAVQEQYFPVHRDGNPDGKKSRLP